MPEHTQPPEGLDPGHSEFPYFSVSHADEADVRLPRDGILLIDDNEDDAELSLRTLHKLGVVLPILWLNDSCKALQALEAAKPSALPRLILLDLRMPRLDGFDILRRLKSNPRTVQTTVIVMVASPRAPEVPRCQVLGANAFVVKPLKAEALLAACERAVLELPLS